MKTHLHTAEPQHTLFWILQFSHPTSFFFFLKLSVFFIYVCESVKFTRILLFSGCNSRKAINIHAFLPATKSEMGLMSLLSTCTTALRKVGGCHFSKKWECSEHSSREYEPWNRTKLTAYSRSWGKNIWQKGHLQNNPGNWRRPGVGSSLVLGRGWKTSAEWCGKELSFHKGHSYIRNLVCESALAT